MRVFQVAAVGLGILADLRSISHWARAAAWSVVRSVMRLRLQGVLQECNANARANPP